METQREALIRVIGAIIETDTGSRKVQQCADAAIAVCGLYHPPAPPVVIGIDMAAPDGDISTDTSRPELPPVPELTVEVKGITPEPKAFFKRWF